MRIIDEILTNFSKAKVDYQTVIRDTVKHIGYNDSSKGLNHKTLDLLIAIEQQSPLWLTGSIFHNHKEASLLNCMFKISPSHFVLMVLSEVSHITNAACIV